MLKAGEIDDELLVGTAWLRCCVSWLVEDVLVVLVLLVSNKVVDSVEGTGSDGFDCLLVKDDSVKGVTLENLFTRSESKSSNLLMIFGSKIV